MYMYYTYMYLYQYCIHHGYVVIDATPFIKLETKSLIL